MAMQCPTCGRNFVCDKPLEHAHGPAHDCYRCWYAREIGAAEERFRPLRDALRERLPWATPEVWQSGGMVMVLGIPMDEAAPLDGTGRYVLFSEHGELDEKAGFGYYEDENGDADEEGRYWFSDIDDDAKNADAIAEWAAPIIQRLFERDPLLTGRSR